MKLYQVEAFPRRVYIDAAKEELDKLSLAVFIKLQAEPNSSSDDVSSIFFYCSDLEAVYFPKGILNIVLGVAIDKGIAITEKDLLEKTYDTDAKDVVKEDMLEGIILRDYQIEGSLAGLFHKEGLVQVPTGGGKTEMMSCCTKYYLDTTDKNILIGVPSNKLLTQTYKRLIKRGIPEDMVSMLGGGHTFQSTRVVVSTVMSAYNRVESQDEKFMEWTRNLKAIFLDEAHHGSAKTWFTLADAVHCDTMLGFSAEPFYNDKDHVIKDMLLRGTLGPIVYRIPLQVLIKRGFLSQPLVYAFQTTYPGNISRLFDWHALNKNGIVNNEPRNKLISDICKLLIDIKKNPLVLVNQVAHGTQLASLISEGDRKVALLTGGNRVAIYVNGQQVDEYHDPEEETLQQFEDGLVDAILGTSVLDEGVDVPSLRSVVLAGGGKSKLKLIQRIGRGLRPKEEDNTTLIIDFIDGFNRITKNQFNERKERGYDANEFPVYYVQDLNAFRYLLGL